MQVSELSGTSPDSPLLQHHHRVLLHLPQSSTATQGHVTALAILNSQVASGKHMETLEMGVIYWGFKSGPQKMKLLKGLLTPRDHEVFFGMKSRLQNL